MASSPSPPDRDPTSSSVPAGAPEPETLEERFLGALPLFVVGGICLALTFALYFAGTVSRFGSSGQVHIEPWVLFLALAVTGLSAGMLAMLLEEEPAAAVAQTPVAAPSPAVVPEWDESTIEPEEATVLPSRTWERYPEPSEELIPDAAPAESIFDQIDEIAASLRRKTTTPPPD